MAGTLTIAGMAQGLLSGGETIGPVTYTGSATVGQRTDVVLSTGDNTIAVPQSPIAASYVYIVVSTSNTATLKLRTNLNGSDAGFPIAVGGPFLAGLAAGTTSVIVNASAGGGVIEVTFI